VPQSIIRHLRSRAIKTEFAAQWRAAVAPFPTSCGHTRPPHSGRARPNRRGTSLHDLESFLSGRRLQEPQPCAAAQFFLISTPGALKTVLC
jgi:hypothetical protein